MRIMILLAAFLTPSSAPATQALPQPAPPLAQAPPKPGSDQPACVRTGIQMSGGPRPRIEMRRLDELPPGRLDLAVMREVDGCVIPAVVREGIGR